MIFHDSFSLTFHCLWVLLMLASVVIDSSCLCMHYSTTTMPLAKVIPIVNGLIYTILADAPNPFVQVRFEIPLDTCDFLLHAYQVTHNNNA